MGQGIGAGGHVLGVFLAGLVCWGCGSDINNNNNNK